MSEKQGRRTRDALLTIIKSTSSVGWGPTQRELGEALGVSAATVNGMLRRLEAQGLIRMLPGSPRAVSVTESGMKALTEVLG